jgi:polysaccharide deacetylase family protein (PEP-CTERM system associated)
MKNALTIDLEDYYQVSAFSAEAPPTNWGSYTSRVEKNTAKLLSLLGSADCRATFFTLGWIAQRYPDLIRQIADQGHEIACHSHLHRLVYSLTPEEFRDDTRTAKMILEDASGSLVQGYRAPSFSITRDSSWAFEVLAELGFTYDSSIFPVQHPSYGVPSAPRFPFKVQTCCGSVVEFPMSTLMLAGRRAPFGGGAYFRLLPYWYTKWGIDLLNRSEGHPACIYIHPWEFDTDQPRLNGHLSAKLRHYLGLRGNEAKLRRLLADFQFVPLSELVSEYAPTADMLWTSQIRS